MTPDLQSLQSETLLSQQNEASLSSIFNILLNFQINVWTQAEPKKLYHTFWASVSALIQERQRRPHNLNRKNPDFS